MADFLSGYSVQYWLESAPQGYLMDTEYGHEPSEKEPGLLVEDPLLGLQEEMSYWMLASFAEAFRQRPAQEELRRMREEARRAGVGNAPAQWQGADLRALDPSEMEALLADTVLKEFKLRLERIGIEYQTPARP